MASDEDEIIEIERDPEFWRDLAEETRAMARQLSDPETIRTLLRVVQEYEHLAVLATSPPGSSSRPSAAL